MIRAQGRGRGNQAALREGRMQQGGRPGLRRRFFRVVTEWTTYAALFYLLLSLPVAIASWVALVVVLAVGAGLSITIVGIPLLFVAMFGWCFYADLERLLSNTLLRTRIRPLPFGHERTSRWIYPRLKARLQNPYTWRTLVFLLFVRFPVGVGGFVVATMTVHTAFQLLVSPLFAAFGNEVRVLAWTIDSAPDFTLAVLLGLALFVPALHVVRWTARLVGAVNTFFLQSPESMAPAPWGDSLDRAATAAVTWPGMLARAHRAANRERSIQVRVWAAHFGLYAAVMVFLLGINGLYAPGQWWVLWPAWGWGIALALHTGYLLRGHLGGHALAFLVTNIGLFVIDAQFAESTWFFWPLIAWAIALAAHAYVYFGFAPIESPALIELAPSGGNGAALEAPPETVIVVDSEMRTVRAAGSRVEVTPKEFELLTLLTGHPGKPFSREELLEKVWKDDYEVTDRTIDTHMQRLRKKLGAAAESIQTVWGVGYRYQP